MKKFLFLLLAASMILGYSCKKEKKTTKKDEPVGTKYAKFRACAYKTPQLKRKECLLVIEKTEPVEYYSSEEKLIKNKKVKVAKIRTTDGKIFYMKENHLADKVIVFTETVSPHTRNNMASSTYGEVPKGTIGFVIDEKGSWTQIYIGKVNGKWITRHWIKEGFSSDENLLADALKYERANKIFLKVKKDKKVSQDKIDKAKRTLNDLSSGQNIFAQMASDMIKKWDELNNKQPDNEKTEKKQDDSKKTGSDNKNTTGQ